MGGHRDSVVGMIGLGLMGSAMSTRLLDAGRDVVGFDVDAAARERHAERGGTAVASIAEACAHGGIVLLSLPNGQATHSVCFDAGGLAETAPHATIVVDTSTVLPDEAIAAGAGLAKAGVSFFDVGISGTSAVVARGESLAAVGGDRATYGDVQALLSDICRQVIYVGALGDGMRAKLVINAVLTVNRYAVAEGLVLAEKMGMDPQAMLETLSASAAYSRAMDMWGQRMVDRQYDPPHSRVRQHSKDGRLILGLGRQYGAPLLAISQVELMVNMALASGWGDADNACIVELLRGMAGIEPVPWPPVERAGDADAGVTNA